MQMVRADRVVNQAEAFAMALGSEDALDACQRPRFSKARSVLHEPKRDMAAVVTREPRAPNVSNIVVAASPGTACARPVAAARATCAQRELLRPESPKRRGATHNEFEHSNHS